MKNMKSKNQMDNSKMENNNYNNNFPNMPNNNSNQILNDNLLCLAESYDSKYSIKINKIKDDFFYFLQK